MTYQMRCLVPMVKSRVLVVVADGSLWLLFRARVRLG